MNKYLTGALAAGALLVASPRSAAYTVDEILANGDLWITKFNCIADLAEVQGGELTHSEGITLTKLSDTQIKFSGFMGHLDFIFWLVDDNGDSTTDGTQMRCAVDFTPDNSAVAGKLYGSTNWKLRPCTVKRGYDYYYREYYVQTAASNSSYWLEIKEASDGSLYFQGEQPINFYSSNYGYTYAGMTDGSDKCPSLYYWDTFYYPAKSNATVTDEFSELNFNQITSSSIDISKARDYNVKRSYPAYVEMDQDTKRFSILNFGNNGYGISKSNDAFAIGGTFEPETGKLIFDTNQFALWQGRCKSNGLSFPINNYPFQLERFTLTDAVKDELFGTYTENHELHHNDAEHGWVSNDGQRVTYKDEVKITVEPYTYYSNQLYYQALNICGAYENTVIDASVEYTLDCDLTINDMKWNDWEGVYVDATINTNKNHELVDHYDIMVMKGRCSSINDEAVNLCSINGHKTARVVADGPDDDRFGNHIERTAIRPMAAGDDVTVNDYRIIKNMPASHLGEEFSTTGEYTFFIRANYKPETGLTPTFHAMASVEPPLPTGVGDITAGGEFTVTAGAGALDIKGNGLMSVYSTGGVEVYNGPAAVVNVTPGIYIVRGADKAVRVVVR